MLTPSLPSLSRAASNASRILSHSDHLLNSVQEVLGRDGREGDGDVHGPPDLRANGAAHASPGQRLGNASPWHQALKGRHKRCLALSGLGMFLAMDPRAMPWAGLSRPFGAESAISTMQIIEELSKLAMGGE